MKRLSLRRFAALVIGVLVAAAFTLVSASPAYAASWHSIAGSTYGNATYYCSANIRTKVGTGAVEAYFTQIVPGGLRFGIASTGCSLITFSDFTVTYNTQEIHCCISSGYRFKNMFRQLDYCQNPWCEHDFAGQELY